MQAAAADTAKEEPPADPLVVRRLRDDVKTLRSSLADTERRAAHAEAYRFSILGLVDEPLQPRLILPDQKVRRPGGRTVILHLTDLHGGEVVQLEQMDGANSYNEAISDRRLDRYFNTAADLMTENWSGAPPEKIILALGGDMVSGSIHPELDQTNWGYVPVTVKRLAERLSGGVALLSNRVQVPVEVYSVPGNHGRQTIKPMSKGRAQTSWDLLVSDFMEACCKSAGLEDVTFYSTQSPDAYFSTYGYHWLLNHGDTTGSKGGQGYIGAAATIIRGHRKLMDTAWRSGRPVHYLLTGHLHTTLRTPFGFAGGSLVGYNEFARDLRLDPEPAKQNMLVVHSQLGVIGMNEIYVGSPEEGTHYHGPASIIRPPIDE